MGFEGARYNPEKIKHVEGQEGPIRDQDKAYAMATREAHARAWADLYKEYSKINDPEEALGFFVKNKDNPAIKEYFDPQFYGPEEAPRWLQVFMENHRDDGVSPEYIARLGELQAEQVGALEDWQKHIQTLSKDDFKELYDRMFDDMYPGYGESPRLDEQNTSLRTNDLPAQANEKSLDALTLGKWEAVEAEQRRRQSLQAGTV